MNTNKYILTGGFNRLYFIGGTNTPDSLLLISLMTGFTLLVAKLESFKICSIFMMFDALSIDDGITGKIMISSSLLASITEA